MGGAPVREPAWWEVAAAVIVLVMLSGAIIGPVFARGATGETPLLRVVWLPVYAIILGLLATRLKEVLRLWPTLLIAMLLVGLAFASKWWSLAPDVTVRRVMALFFTSLFAVWLAATFPGRRLPVLLAWTGLFMGIGALLFVFGWPAVGVHHEANAGLWRGMWSEKNQMGWVMTGSAVAAAAVIASPGKGREMAVVSWLLSVLLVLGTQSKTSLLCLIGATALIGGLWILRKVPPALTVAGVWLGVIVAGAIVAVAIYDSGLILQALGKDPTLTGRTQIWDALFRQSALRPWTGYGYSAFWGSHSTPANYIRLETQWVVPSAHNGWMEILVELGRIGIAAIGFTVAMTVLGTLTRLGGTGRQEGFWAMGYLVAYLILSFSESILMRHQSLPWVLFLVASARIWAPVEIMAPLRDGRSVRQILKAQRPKASRSPGLAPRPRPA